jgi:hypothetical protein
VFGRRVDRLGGQFLQLFDLDVEGVALVLEASVLKEPTSSGTCAASLEGFPGHRRISSEARLEMEDGCAGGRDGVAFIEHGLNDIESVFPRLGSSELVGDSGGCVTDVLVHFFGGSVVVQRSEELRVRAEVVGEVEE